MKEENQNPINHFDRRSFLKLSGFSVAGAVLAGCQPIKVEKVIPLLIKPEEITPGVSNWFATTCHGCTANCGVLVKSRDGRPIKIEGNKEHPFSVGGVCAIGQAQVLGLYDSRRFKTATENRNEIEWNVADKNILSELEKVKNKKIYFLSYTITSPSLRSSIKSFLSKYKNAELVEYEAMSQSAILDANEKNFGTRFLPAYKFNKAELIVSVDVDFLGSWISPVEFTKAYTELRSLDKDKNIFSEHIQIEARLSLTGSNADKRYKVNPTEYGEILNSLYENIKFGKKSKIEFVNKIADKLISKKGKSLVICGVNEVTLQQIVNGINYELNNFGNTIDISNTSKQLNGNDKKVEDLIAELKTQSVGAIFVNANPVYDFENGNEFSDLLKNVPLTVSFSTHLDETSNVTKYNLPQNHWLESWSDSEAISGIVSITQPLINPLENTRTVFETVNKLNGNYLNGYEALVEYWEKEIYPNAIKAKNFGDFWNKTVHDGFAKINRKNNSVGKFNFVKPELEIITADGFSLVLYEKISMRDGKNAHNAWLQELDDPITKISWDNYASISKQDAERIGISEGEILLIENGNKKIKLPAHIQIGQKENTIAVAVGYGRFGTDRFTNIGPEWFQSNKTVEVGGTIGKNIYPFINTKFVKILNTGEKYTLANSQLYNSLQLPENLGYKGEERTIVQHATFSEYQKNNSAGSVHHGELLSMWTETPRGSNIHWGLSIDLTKCIGCSACIVSCQAENNIPVVGKDEMHRDRDLHWIRIDRYFNENNGDLDVIFQPMLCQHCGNAPCETVCPVLATVHSEDGLNQQVYNRCVGTKYCANNCPYKVRRFNWFQYEHNDDREKLVLNPDVTVRERGVIEKCSMCIQRIQEVKILAKKEGREIFDGEILPACAQSCPSQAIVFGNIKDEKSQISKLAKDERAFHVLEEIGVKPSINYLTRIKNQENVNG